MPKGSIIKTLPLSPILVANSPLVIDLTNAQTRGVIDQIQAIWVDNSNGAGALTINTGVVNQNISVPAGYQGFIPALVSNPPVLTLLSSVNLSPFLQLLNVPMPVGLWASGGYGSKSVAKAAAANIIAAGGTAIVAVNGPFNGAIINNPLTATGQNIATAEPLFINFVGLALTTEGGNTFALQPGKSFTSPTGFNSSITVNAATSGHVFSAISW